MTHPRSPHVGDLEILARLRIRISGDSVGAKIICGAACYRCLVDRRFQTLRDDFPALRSNGLGRDIVYLDSAATTQRPRVVLEAMQRYEEGGVGNPHRGVHRWAAQSDAAYERARGRVARFLHAATADEIVFTRNATEALNLIAALWAPMIIGERRRVLVSELEHHANLLPWQRLCQLVDAELVVLPMTDAGDLELDRLPQLLDARTAIVAVCHVSNAIGTRVSLAPIVARAREVGARVVVDGAQAAAHLPVDVQALGVDAYVVSGHKLYGPTGIGALWMRREILHAAEPWQRGGGIVTSVSMHDATFTAAPARFEPGTPHVAGAVGLHAALDFLETLGLDAIASHDAALLASLLARLETWPGVRILGRPLARVGLVSFVVDGIHPHDVGSLLDGEGVAVRTGLHCAEPALRRLGARASVRVSLGVYTTEDDLERFFSALGRVQAMFG